VHVLAPVVAAEEERVAVEPLEEAVGDRGVLRPVEEDGPTSVERPVAAAWDAEALHVSVRLAKGGNVIFISPGVFHQ
jgi:hypothetical protein